MDIVEELKADLAAFQERLAAANRRDQLRKQGITVLSIERAMSPTGKALRRLLRQART
jgi:hypothetical protein